MDLLKGLKRELPCLKSGFALVLGGAGALLSLIVMVACGNFFIYKLLLMPRHAPPPILFFLAVFLFSAYLGYIIGVLYDYMKRGRAFNALLFAVLTLLFFQLWYLSFFKTAALLFALFMLIMALFLALMMVKEGCVLGILPPVLGAGAVLSLLCFLWLTFSALLLN